MTVVGAAGLATATRVGTNRCPMSIFSALLAKDAVPWLCIPVQEEEDVCSDAQTVKVRSSPTEQLTAALSARCSGYQMRSRGAAGRCLEAYPV